MHHRQGEQHLVPSTVHAMSLPVEYVGQDNDRNIDAGGISKDKRKKRRQGEHTHGFPATPLICKGQDALLEFLAFLSLVPSSCRAAAYFAVLIVSEIQTCQVGND